MSMPGQKPRPAPVTRPPARRDRRRRGRRARRTPRASATSTRSSVPGRFSVIVATPSATRQSTSSSSWASGIGEPYAPASRAGQRDGRSSRDWNARELGLLHRARVPGAARLGRASSAATRSFPSTCSSRARRSRRDPRMKALVDPLKQQVKDRGLWALFLDEDLGGPGLRSAPAGVAQRDPRPARIGAGDLRDAGPRHREHGDPRRLRHRRAEGTVAVSADEPGDLVGVLDDRAAGRLRPALFKTEAVRDGDEWVINGEKWFTSFGEDADIILVMCRTASSSSSRALPGSSGCTAPGATHTSDTTTCGSHSTISSDPEGGGRTLAQRRLGGGRIHHAMRTVAACKKAIDMMCERALSRQSHGKVIADHRWSSKQSPTRTPSTTCCGCWCCGRRGRSTTRSTREARPDRDVQVRRARRCSTTSCSERSTSSVRSASRTSHRSRRCGRRCRRSSSWTGPTRSTR